MTLVTPVMAAPRISAAEPAAPPVQPAPKPAVIDVTEPAMATNTVIKADPVDTAEQNIRARALLALVPVPVEAIPWLGAQVNEIRDIAP